MHRSMLEQREGGLGWHHRGNAKVSTRDKYWGNKSMKVNTQSSVQTFKSSSPAFHLPPFMTVGLIKTTGQNGPLCVQIPSLPRIKGYIILGRSINPHASGKGGHSRIWLMAIVKPVHP